MSSKAQIMDTIVVMKSYQPFFLKKKIKMKKKNWWYLSEIVGFNQYFLPSKLYIESY